MDNPFRPEHFERIDDDPDGAFYVAPRLVRHIDDPACAALAGYFAETVPGDATVLDLMASYASHLPRHGRTGPAIGLGMNAPEMAANPQLDAGIVHDLNADPALPFRDGVFDACLLTVSVQYLTSPVAVFADVGRVLRAGAPFIVSFSNRMFPTKAIALWRGTGDADHAKIVALYFALSGRFEGPEFHDLSPSPGASDPIYAVTARKSAETG